MDTMGARYSEASVYRDLLHIDAAAAQYIRRGDCLGFLETVGKEHVYSFHDNIGLTSVRLIFLKGPAGNPVSSRIQYRRQRQI